MTLPRDILHGGYPTSESKIVAHIRTAAQREPTTKSLFSGAEKTCISSTPIVSSLHEIAARPPHALKEQKMTLTLKTLNRRKTQAIYSGLRTAVRFPLSAFSNKTAPPQNIEIEGDFAEARGPKVAMTAEERKAARAARPKLTLAERVLKAEQRTAELRKKLEAEAQAQPASV